MNKSIMNKIIKAHKNAEESALTIVRFRMAGSVLHAALSAPKGLGRQTVRAVRDFDTDEEALQAVLPEWCREMERRMTAVNGGLSRRCDWADLIYALRGVVLAERFILKHSIPCAKVEIMHRHLVPSAYSWAGAGGTIAAVWSEDHGLYLMIRRGNLVRVPYGKGLSAAIKISYPTPLSSLKGVEGIKASALKIAGGHIYLRDAEAHQ